MTDVGSAAEVVRGFYESFVEKDMGRTFDRYISVDLKNHGFGGAYDRDAWQQAEQAMAMALDDYAVEVLDQVVDRDKVASRVVISGVQNAEFLGIPASGRTGVMTLTAIDRVADGKIVEHWVDLDWGAFVQQLSADETPSSTLPDRFEIMGEVSLMHVGAEQTGGSFFVVEVDVVPGGGPPPLHTHRAHEYFRTLEGELTYFRDLGRGLETISGGPGTTAFVPGGRPHTYRNLTDRPARYLGVVSPAEPMESFMRAADTAGRPALRPAEVLSLGEQFGIVTSDVVPGTTD